MGWMEILVGTLAGGVVLFVWYAIAWMALPHHNADFRPMGAAEEGVAAALRAHPLQPGYYMMPHFETFEGGMKDPALDARSREGPNAQLIVMPVGPCMRPQVFLQGFLLNLFTAFGGVVVLFFARGMLGGPADTVLFFAGLGVLVHAPPLVAQSIWMQYPWRNTLTSVFDGIVGFALLGLVLHFVT